MNIIIFMNNYHIYKEKLPRSKKYYNRKTVHKIIAISYYKK